MEHLGVSTIHVPSTWKYYFPIKDNTINVRAAIITLDQRTWTFSRSHIHFFIKPSCWNVEVETISERRDPWPDLTIMLVSDDKRSLNLDDKEKYLARIGFSKNNLSEIKLTIKSTVGINTESLSSLLCKLHCKGEEVALYLVTASSATNKTHFWDLVASLIVWQLRPT